MFERQKFNVDHKEFWLATEGVKRKLILSRSSVWLDLARSRCLWVTLTPATHSIVKQDLVWFAAICCKLWRHSSMEVWWITHYNMAEYGRVMPWFLWKRWVTLTAAHPLVSSQLTHHPLNLLPEYPARPPLVATLESKLTNNDLFLLAQTPPTDFITWVSLLLSWMVQRRSFSNIYEDVFRV